MMHKAINCRAGDDYRLWISFDDGLQGSVYLGNLLSVGAFQSFRDERVFSIAVVDRDGAIRWPLAGIRLDPEILWLDLAAGRQPKAARLTEARNDKGLQRFLRKALSKTKRAGKR